ncbi:MAG: hypothetical protein IT317_19890 [Anaerolineales bacterium]|nr:hypothetical protein [Anaerolineales bacterium]
MRAQTLLTMLVAASALCAGRMPAPTATGAPRPGEPSAAATTAPAASPTAAPAATTGPALASAAPEIAGCQVFPADNIWNTPVDTLPVHPNSAAFVETIGLDANVHADFGSGEWDGGPIGIPYVVVPGSQAKVSVEFVWDDESDPGPYPVPANPPIEGGPDADGDRHILMLDSDNCILYELFHAYPEGGGEWSANAGAIFDLGSNLLRPDTWTSADAAGLPILPGLARYDEVASGEITHALRFTAPETLDGYLWPARHEASDLTGSEYPPLGLRLRLRADFDISGYSAPVQVILRALKKYGLILADNGSPWYISGAPDERWDNEMLHELDDVLGSDFVAVDTSGLRLNPDSGQVKPPVVFTDFLFLPLLNRLGGAGR